jgi:hypothetical protein
VENLELRVRKTKMCRVHEQFSRKKDAKNSGYMQDYEETPQAGELSDRIRRNSANTHWGPTVVPISH